MTNPSASWRRRGIVLPIVSAVVACIGIGLSGGHLNLHLSKAFYMHDDSVVTDITVIFCPTTTPCADPAINSKAWHRLDKDLYLRQSGLQSAWLYTERKRRGQLTRDDKVLMDIVAGELEPGEEWERRPSGFWIQRKRTSKVKASSEAFITEVDILFGTDAVDPRPNWVLTEKSLNLATGGETPVTRLSIRHGTLRSIASHPRPSLTFRSDGNFKIVQIADIHGSTGPGFCRDAVDAQGSPLPEVDADSRTIEFVSHILDDEQPDLVVLGGDNVHFTALDTKSTILKFVAPMIERGIPYAAIFGNHDDSGRDSLSRKEQMALFQSLPYSLSEPGPEHVDGVGNYHIRIKGRPDTQDIPLDLLFMDTHNVIPAEGYVYDSIKPSQIDWLRSTMRRLKNLETSNKAPLSLLFIHIPIPEYDDSGFTIAGGQKHEAVCSPPRDNSIFYDTLVHAGVSALSCGHDHVNDYCAVKQSRNGNTILGPWLCYGGGSGFGAYGGHGWYHRRARVFEVDSSASRIVTWKRVEYHDDDHNKKVDELTLVDGGEIVGPS